ncbi:Ornithine carbamoyltransferase [Saliniradius amylolyticus]|uniref:Ornithine carbamoyltransferase n=1 Tax=Saliniradius amylolyticus TaxID=2183582 RepID=A0A2S2E6I4_9ALTE|nr:ornithine carbamoyltransferase [Saliniradius amylolyticus]AWL13209.1 Ornithine carbamoyltransferase [Saliniradius amylolyticus]
MSQSLLTFSDWSASSIQSLLQLALEVKQQPQRFRQALTGKSVVALFEKPSLRTRVSFDIGVNKLGGHLVYLDSQANNLAGREASQDMGANLSCWADAIVARVFSHQTLEQLVAASKVPVINALCDLYHPCQALADYLSLAEVLPGKTPSLGYVGDANNVSNSLMLLGAKLGADVRIVTPGGHQPATNMIAQSQDIAAETGGNITVSTELAALEGVDALYTDTWLSMGDETPLEAIKDTFAPYQLNTALMRQTGAQYVMHCQPAHRDLEISSELIDGDASLLMRQAENRMHGQNAILISLLERK